MGTLDSLNVTNGVTAATLTGAIQTASQPLITSVGTLGSLNVTNGVTAATLTGAIQTASQTKITTVGTLTGLSVGAVSPGFPLYVSGTYSPTTPTSYVSLNSYGSVSTASTSPVSVSIACTGRILCNGELDVASDFRIKENISMISQEDVNKFIDTIVPVRYNYKTEKGRMNFGYIAQDVARHNIQELLTANADDSLEEYVDEDGFTSPNGIRFGVITGNIIPLLHMKVKSLSDENAELKDHIASLQKQMQLILSRIDNLEN